MDLEPDLGAAWTAAMRRGDFPGAWEIGDPVLRRRRAAGERPGRLPRHDHVGVVCRAGDWASLVEELREALREAAR